MSSQVGPVCDRCKNVNSLIVVVENVEWCNRCGALYDGRNLPQPYRADLAPSLPEDEGERLRERVEALRNELGFVGGISRHILPIKGRSYLVQRLDDILLSRSPAPPTETAEELGDVAKGYLGMTDEEFHSPTETAERCPTCKSDDPGSMYSAASGSQTVPSYCPDPFHSGPPGKSHPPDGSSEGRRIAAPEITSQQGERFTTTVHDPEGNPVSGCDGDAIARYEELEVATERQSLRASMAESRYEKAKAALEQMVGAPAQMEPRAGRIAEAALANLETEE